MKTLESCAASDGAIVFAGMAFATRRIPSAIPKCLSIQLLNNNTHLFQVFWGTVACVELARRVLCCQLQVYPTKNHSFEEFRRALFQVRLLSANLHTTQQLLASSTRHPNIAMLVVSMEVEFLDESRAALEANLSTRFHYKAKLQLKSRHPSDVIPWAQEAAEKVANEVIKALGATGHATDTTVQLNLVQLEHDEALLYFDLFRQKRNGQVRINISRTLHQPIYHIIKDRKVFYILRNKQMDDVAAKEYEAFRKVDQGLPPYFSDPANPPIRLDRQHIERRIYGTLDLGEVNWRKAMSHVFGRKQEATRRMPEEIWEWMTRRHDHQGRYSKGLELAAEESAEDEGNEDDIGLGRGISRLGRVEALETSSTGRGCCGRALWSKINLISALIYTASLSNDGKILESPENR